MSRRLTRAVVLLVAALPWGLVWPPTAAAHGGTPGDLESHESRAVPDEAEMRERMRVYFRARLRADLGLDDAQAAVVLPRIEAVERARGEARRERARLLADLRRLVRAGARDDEIRGALQRLDDLEADQISRVRGQLREVDGALTVRQRAELRLFLERFRREMARRVEALRGEDGSDRRPRARP